MRQAIKPIVTWTFTLAAIAACGGGPPGVPTQPAGGGVIPTASAQAVGSIDACTLLSDQEIEAATGERVVERSTSALRPDVFPSICDIELDNAGSLTVSIRSSGGRSMYETSFEPFIGQESYLDEAVDGLGDKAGRAGDDTLMVLKDDVLFDIQFLAFGRQDKLTVVRYLAEVVLAKLGCLAAGCPGFTPPPPPATAQAVDVCALLADDEIENATGFPVLSSEPAGGRGLDASCTWTVDADPSLPGLYYFEIVVRDSGGRQEFDFLAEEAFEDPPEHVPGLGDDAIKTGTIPGGSVYAVVGDRLVTLRFSMPLAVEDPYALVVPLLEIALTRL